MQHFAKSSTSSPLSAVAFSFEKLSINSHRTYAQPCRMIAADSGG